jgi:hypothetical protein
MLTQTHFSRFPPRGNGAMKRAVSESLVAETCIRVTLGLIIVESYSRLIHGFFVRIRTLETLLYSRDAIRTKDGMP